MWYLNIDEIPQLAKTLPLLSHNSKNVYSFRDDDHLYLGKETLRENIETYLINNGIHEKPTTIFVLTNLRTFGYVFNPVSFFICFDEAQKPLAVVVEVHNTYGELKPFLLTKDDLKQGKFAAKRDKHFYISPFSHLDHQLEIKVSLPTDSISMQVNNYDHGESKPFFCSSLTGKKDDLNNKTLLAYSLRFPLITLKVITMIHWHAVKLYLKKVPFYPKSKSRKLQRGIHPKKFQKSNHE